MALLEFDDQPENRAKIKGVGVGGGGGNAINTMIEAHMEGVDFIAANTDVQALDFNQAPTKLGLGASLTKGLGAGANPEIGRNAALEDIAKITDALAGADMVFATAGRGVMGGGRAMGENGAMEAAKQAISSPLLEDVSITGATGILINITGGPELSLAQVNEAALLIQEAAHEEANIIFGSVVDANIGDEVRVTVIATGFDRAALMGVEAAPVVARRATQITMTYVRPAAGQATHPSVAEPTVHAREP